MLLWLSLTKTISCNGKSAVLKSVGFINIANKSCCEANLPVDIFIMETFKLLISLI